MARYNTWMNRFTGQSIENLKNGVDIHSGFNELRQARTSLDQEILKWIGNLQEEWLNKPFEFISKVDSKKRVLPGLALITRMFNHQTHKSQR